MAPAVLLWAASGVAITAYLAHPGGLRTVLIAALLILAPLAAFGAGLGAARTVARGMASPWMLIALAGAAAAAGQLHWHDTDITLESWHALFDVAALGLIALALGWMLHQRERGRGAEIVLDVGLILTAATVVTLRWSPVARTMLGDPDTWSPVQQVSAIGAPIAAGCAFLFANVLLIVRGASPAGAAVAALAAGTAGLTLGVVPLALGREPCCDTGDATGLAFVLGWLSVAYAGVRVRRLGSRAFRPMAADSAGARLRMVVAPAVAVVISAVVIDAVVGAPMNSSTGKGIAVLGVLLALRVSQLLAATRTQSAERIELGQSRAMIEVSQALAGTTRLDETLDLITSHAVRVLEGRAASIELLTGDGRHLEFHAVHGLPRELLHARFPVEGSFSGWVVLHGRARAVADPHTDPYLTDLSLPYVDRAPVAAAPLRYRAEVLGALTCFGHHPFDETDLQLLMALADQAAVAIENVRLFQQVHHLSMTDPLTGLANRRQLERDLEREFAAAGRGRQLIAVMFDLNDFKEYNDRWGHLAGDRAIRLFARALATETRTMNMAARYGGDEFLVLLADADREGAESFIDRVRRRFPGPDADVSEQALTVAAGYAEYAPDMLSPEDLIAAADRALYRAKSLKPARA